MACLWCRGAQAVLEGDVGNREHVAKLREGPEAWNAWRNNFPSLEPDLRDEDLGFLCEEKFDAEHTGRPLNLTHAHLQRAQLQHARLNRAQLQGARLNRAQLQHARLRWACLQGARLRWACLQGADLGRAHLEDADLQRVRLEGAQLWRAHLEHASLKAAHVEGARLAGVHLGGADLAGVHLGGADLRWGNFEGANLGCAHLGGADLRSADLSNADLRETRGLRLDDTRILHARFTPAPGNFLARLLPWFIFDRRTDAWSELRRSYTGPNFIVSLLVLAAFLVPLVIQAQVWQGVNLLQGLMQHVGGNAKAAETLLSVKPCFAAACRPFRVWQLLLGFQRGRLLSALTITLIVYNLAGYYVMRAVSSLREEEERSGFAPMWRAEPSRVAPKVRLAGAWSRARQRGEAFLGGYQHLAWLHVALRCLLWVAVVSFVVNYADVLGAVVQLPAK